MAGYLAHQEIRRYQGSINKRLEKEQLNFQVCLKEISAHCISISVKKIII